MSLIGLIVVLVIIGVLLWAVQQLPIDGTIKRIIYVLVVVFAVLYVLQALGLIGSLDNIRLR